MKCCEYSPWVLVVKFTTLSLFVTYEWAHYARVFVPGKPFQPSVLYHSSLLDSYLSNEEIEVLWLRSLSHIGEINDI